jgi:hypothetical protein
VQPVVPQLTEPGKAPPRPVADAGQPVISILMVRNLGNRRRPAAEIAIGAGLLFGLAISALQKRDKAAMAAVAASAAGS